MREIIMCILLGALIGALILQYVDLMLLTFTSKNVNKKKRRGSRHV